METLFDIGAGTRAAISPRCYQIRDHDESFRLWDSGEIGVLTRAATGSGKTLMACLKIDTWLRRSERHRAMVISYENQLVFQFAQEVEDYLGIKPGIEMGNLRVDADDMPKVCVASRQSLLQHKKPTPEQVAELLAFGISDLGPCDTAACKKFINFLKKPNRSIDIVIEEIERIKKIPEACNGTISRLHKFDWRYDWLVVFDEAHKHAEHMKSVANIVAWFEQNPSHRRNGITATPKRGDNISIGYKMFPGVALDYPLYSPMRACAVTDGFAVPYQQFYIEVNDVDFSTVAKINGDFDEDDLARVLGEETVLAKIVIPLLDKVGDRKTLIFSPGVEMAKNVARFINARVETRCECGKVKWYPRALVGDGATCECKKVITQDMITADGEQARELDGESHIQSRRDTYRDHQEGKFQFLSVCGLCREGYNDPEISCVAIFRPVSKKASSLAEQMKGRSCRPLRDILNGLKTAEERRAAIAASAKPFAMIIDLVGVTGLADCATTAQIYAEGMAGQLKEEGHEDAASLADEIAEKAQEKLLDGGGDIQEALADAKRESLEQREKAKREREAAEEKARKEAERRAKAGAEVSYTEHAVGTGSQVDPLVATDKQYDLLRRRGMDIKVMLSKKKAGRIIDQIVNQKLPCEEAARLNKISEGDWSPVKPEFWQINKLKNLGIDTRLVKTPYDAFLLMDAKQKPENFLSWRMDKISKCRNLAELGSVGDDLRIARGVLPQPMMQQLIEAGLKKKATLTPEVKPEVKEDW